MTTTTFPPRRPSAVRTRGVRALLVSEARLFVRDWGNVIFGVGFPTILLVGLGLVIPGMREPLPESAGALAGLEAIHLFAPIAVCVAIATTGLSTLPPVIAAYRERGVLRRLSTTPMRPQGVLAVQVVVQMAATVVGIAVAMVTAGLLYGVPAPERPWLLVLLAVPTVLSIFGLGLIIGGLAPKATTASGIGMLVYFPMLFFAGLWTPAPVMPDGLATVARYTPLGAASQSMTGAWFGTGGFPGVELVVMTVWGVVAFVIAARTFRWS